MLHLAPNRRLPEHPDAAERLHMNLAVLMAPAGVAFSRQGCRLIQFRQPFIGRRVWPCLCSGCVRGTRFKSDGGGFRACEDQPGGLFRNAQAVQIRSGHLPGAQTGFRPRAI